MKVVVTGASGFLAGRVIRSLLSQGIECVGVARRAVPEALRVVRYSDAPGGDVLVHLAEESDRARAAEGGIAYEKAAAETLTALLAKGYSRVVYASSSALYGDQSPRAHQGSDAVFVTDTYTRIKRDAELAVLQGPGVVARLANLYGPGMASSNVVSTILRQIPGEGALKVLDDAPVRDFLWAEDAASAIAAMVMGRPNGLFNVGSGQGTSIRDLAATALSVAGQESRMIVATSPTGRQSHLVLDIESTTTTFSWCPRVPLDEGLRVLMARKSAH
jgi:nucleoside-diphosphate-sugar epimerase